MQKAALGAGRREFSWDMASYRQNLPYLTQYLSTLLEDTGRVERRVATARYIEGLLIPGHGKLIRPLAERLGVDPQSLQQAIANRRWDPAALWSTMRRELIPRVGTLSEWHIHERVWPKQGEATVGVANQRCGAHGKSAHCQVSLELLGSEGSFAVPLASRLYLPEEWTEDTERRIKGEIPEQVTYQNKPAIALGLIQEAIGDGMEPGIVCAEATYGNNREFRLALAQMGVEFFLKVDATQVFAWDFDHPSPVNPRDLQPRTLTLEEIARAFGPEDWSRVCWTNHGGMQRRTRIGVREIFVDLGPSELEGGLEKLQMVVDWPEDAPAPWSVYLVNWHRPRNSTQCLRLSRLWAWEEHYRGYFEKLLDLGTYQGRSWIGFHHHLVLAASAYLFVLLLERRSLSQFWAEPVSRVPVDSAIAAETHRLTGILFRSFVPEAALAGSRDNRFGVEPIARRE